MLCLALLATLLLPVGNEPCAGASLTKGWWATSSVAAGAELRACAWVVHETEPNGPAFGNDPNQKDQGHGLRAYKDGDGVHVVSVKTGKDIALFRIREGSSWHRVGAVICVRHTEDGKEYFDLHDALTGKVALHKPYWIAWDGKRRRLAFSEASHPLAPRDVDRKRFYVVYEMKPGSLEPVRWCGCDVPLVDHDEFASDPDKTPFVLRRVFDGVGVERQFHQVIDKDFHLVPKLFDRMFAVSDRYIVCGEAVKRRDPRFTDPLKSLSCLSADGKKVYWRKLGRLAWTTRVEVAGNRVSVVDGKRTRVYDARTGKLLGTKRGGAKLTRVKPPWQS